MLNHTIDYTRIKPYFLCKVPIIPFLSDEEVRIVTGIRITLDELAKFCNLGPCLEATVKIP